MTRIYVLTEGSYSDYRIVGIFSTREGAEKVMAGAKGAQVEEWGLDAITDLEWGTTWHADIRLSDGLARQRYEEEGFRHPTETAIQFYPEAPGFPALIEVRSPISAEHAIKVAVEKRQEWLRTKELKGEAR